MPTEPLGNAFYGEEGVHRHMNRVYDQPYRWPTDDYSRDNPDGSMYGRRNYRETVYYSGTERLSPGEYRPGVIPHG
jgi:hypothetical protein